MDPAAGGVAECLWNALAQVAQGHIAANLAVNGTGLHASALEKFN